MTAPATLAPYAGLAPHYDRLVGDAGFEVIWRAFCAACRTYGIRFTSAADIGCGTGRFLARLAAAVSPAVTLFGVDRSREMLAVARRRLAGTPVRLMLGDLRGFALPSPVQLVTCNYDTINYVLRRWELEQAIGCLSRSLSQNGHVVVDMLRQCAAAQPMVKFRQHIKLGDVRAIWVSEPAPEAGGSTVTMSICAEESGGRRCWREQHRQRWWSLDLLVRMLANAGLRVLGVHRLPDYAPVGIADRWVQLVARRC